MIQIAFDTETALIARALLAPPMACLSWANENLGTGLFHHSNLGEIERLLGTADLYIGANVAYDSGVLCARYPELMPLIFDLYRDSKIVDIQLNQKLIDIARGELGGRWKAGKYERFSYSLDALYQRYGGEPLDKSTWRLRYGELIDVPIAEWPEGARAYPEDDAAATMYVHLVQQEFKEYLGDGPAQARAAFAMHLQSCHGIMTDPVAVKALAEETEKTIEQAKKIAQAAGLVDAKGTSKKAPAADLMLRVCAEKGIEIKLTEKGQKNCGSEYVPALGANPKFVCLDDESCEASGDPSLIAYSTYGSANVLRTRVKTLELGTVLPLQTRYDTLKETGRTSSQKPGPPLIGDNFQNPPQKGGYRECFIPRPGFVFCSIDFNMAELVSLAQVCVWLLGESRLGEVLNEGKDPHAMMGATMMGVTYDDFIARRKAKDPEAIARRNRSKGPNFGLPGGMGPDGLVRYLRAGEMHITRTEAEDLISYWHETWPEMKDYFKIIKEMDTVTQFVSGRIRGGASYCARANSLFQGLTADAAKACALPMARECYVESDSPLYGSRPVIFIHDEFLFEMPEHSAHSAAYRARDIMVETYQKYTPQIKINATPALMRKWVKESETVHNASGILIPAEDKAA